MLGPDPLDAFYLALEESPGDIPTLLALSDWLDEQGDANAADCIRWSAARKRRLFRYRAGSLSVAGMDWHDGWFWWANADSRFGADWGHPEECRVPHGLWLRLRHGHDAPPLVFKEYATVRQAYEALIAAWPRVHPLENWRWRWRSPR